VKINRIGDVPYADLDEETATDVALSIGWKTGEIEGDEDDAGLEEVRAGLDNGAILPLVEVDAKALLKSSPGRRTSKPVVRDYADEMDAGAEFPPVVIDSSLKKDNLIEGGHRTSAAAKIGSVIKAIDIAGVRIGRQEDGLETYVFPR
jgi:hypothetical protein